MRFARRAAFGLTLSFSALAFGQSPTPGAAPPMPPLQVTPPPPPPAPLQSLANRGLKFPKDKGDPRRTGPNLSQSKTPSEGVQIAASGDDVYVVWSDRAEGNGDIFLAVSNDAGASWWPNVNVSRSSTHSMRPTIAVDGRSVVIGWLEVVGGEMTAWVATSNDGENAIGAPRKVSRDGAVIQSVRAAAGKGKMAVAFIEQGGSQAALLSVPRYRELGVAQEATVDVTRVTGGWDLRSPHLALGNAGVAMSWEQRAPLTSAWQVQRATMTSGAWTVSGTQETAIGGRAVHRGELTASFGLRVDGQTTVLMPLTPSPVDQSRVEAMLVNAANPQLVVPAGAFDAQGVFVGAWLGGTLQAPTVKIWEAGPRPASGLAMPQREETLGPAARTSALGVAAGANGSRLVVAALPTDPNRAPGQIVAWSLRRSSDPSARSMYASSTLFDVARTTTASQPVVAATASRFVVAYVDESSGAPDVFVRSLPQ